MKKAIRKIISLILAGMLLLGAVGCVKVEEIPYSQVTVEDAVFEDKFYYAQLDENGQSIYKEVYQGIIDHQEKIYVHSDNAEEVNEILSFIVYDFAEIFWTDGGSRTTAYEEGLMNEGYAVVEPAYVYSLDERRIKEQEIEAAVEQVTNGVPANCNDYEKVKYIYEYLVNSVQYVEGAPDNQNIYSALIRKESVCAGYAKANQYLLNRLGIYCTYVIGTAVQEEVIENHAWNIVRCNGQYYYVDVTWADPLATEVQSDVQPDMIYDYLCCSESEMSSTHQASKDYEYPQCVSDDLNYYRMNQMYYEAVDRNTLLNAMYESVNTKEKNTTFKFSDSALYQEGKELVLQDLVNPVTERIARRYGLSQVKYYYEENPAIHKLVIYWFYE